MGEPVLLHVYDVTKGLARNMSQQLIGTQIEGIWHTGTVCFGKEFFFGSFGVDFCPPNGTVLGSPDQVLPVGTTQLPTEIVEEWVSDAGSERFAGSRYHLLHHNCNNFSAEFVSFLTGQDIPDHILKLPEQVAATPMGQMILQMLANFDPSGSHR